MHEVSIADSCLKLAFERARDAGGKSITRLTLRIGRLSGVVPEALSFAFECLTEGTMAQGAAVDIEDVPVVARCPECVREFEPTDMVFACPDCGRPSPEIIHGREMQLVSMEIEGEDDGEREPAVSGADAPA